MKERLDILLVKRQFSESREKAKTLIMTGNIFVNGQREDKAGAKVDINSDIIVKGNPIPYVSRGGLKLEKAMDNFELQLNEKVCMDVGASTGGFTDCMLQNGAKKVYAIDVGYGQLAWKLRQDSRVICMEKTNIRYVTEKHITEKINFTSIDVSFISLKKVIEPIKALLDDNYEIVCLIKPQFEAGREQVGKKGVVRDKNIHKDVIKGIIEYAKSLDFKINGLSYSPIKGPEGNIEYLLYLTNLDSEKNIDIVEIVEKAHDSL